MNQFSVGLYSKDFETSMKLENHLYRLENKFLGVVIFPLSWTKIKPDLILSYCLPAQVMHYIQSYLYIKGGVRNCKIRSICHPETPAQAGLFTPTSPT